jgi:hypothetical protein
MNPTNAHKSHKHTQSIKQQCLLISGKNATLENAERYKDVIDASELEIAVHSISAIIVSKLAMCDEREASSSISAFLLNCGFWSSWSLFHMEDEKSITKSAAPNSSM